MDVSHVPFTHHNSVGKRENATPVNLELTSESGVTAKGFEGIWQEGPRKGKYGSQYTEYNAPTLMRHTLKTPAFTTLTVVYAVPTTPGRCRLMARFPFIFKSALPRFFFGLYPQWFSHTNQNAILEDDQIFLHKQERSIEIEQRAGKSYAQSCYMPTKADVYVSAFRKWIVDIAGGGPAWPKAMKTDLPPQETTREALLDRYHSHTINCKSCSKALATIGGARKALRALTFIAPRRRRRRVRSHRAEQVHHRVGRALGRRRIGSRKARRVRAQDENRPVSAAASTAEHDGRFFAPKRACSICNYIRIRYVRTFHTTCINSISITTPPKKRIKTPASSVPSSDRLRTRSAPIDARARRHPRRLRATRVHETLTRVTPQPRVYNLIRSMLHVSQRFLAQRARALIERRPARVFAETPPAPRARTPRPRIQSPTATTTRPRVRRAPWTLGPSPRVPRRARDSPRTLYAALERQSLVSFEDIFEDIFENSREECAVRRRATRAHLERLGRSRAREKVRLVHVRAVAHFDFRFTRGHARETTSDARGGLRRRRYNVGATRRSQSWGHASRDRNGDAVSITRGNRGRAG